MNFDLFIFAALTTLGFSSCAFAGAYLWRRNDLADVIWGPGFIVAAAGGWWFSVASRSLDARLALTFALVGIWALRLALHIGKRNFSHSREDARYAQWRKDWGSNWIWRSYLQVFVLQGALLLIIDLPLLWLIASPALALDPVAYFGAFVWFAGFVFEVVSDEQLRRFRLTGSSSSGGPIMRSGLWSWSRHPNYFGEVTQWWGIYLLAVSVPGGWFTILSPLTLTFLILKVSGVTMLEKAMQARPGWEEYRQETSAFVPWPPKRKSLRS